ncbi:MAG: hypothetical protein ABID67_02580 [Candidatus Nealsonbacteria bacterium]
MNKIEVLYTKSFVLEGVFLSATCILLFIFDPAELELANIALACVFTYIFLDVFSIILRKWNMGGIFVKRIYMGIVIIVCVGFISGAFLVIEYSVAPVDTIYASGVIIYLLARLGRNIIIELNPPVQIDDQGKII